MSLLADNVFYAGVKIIFCWQHIPNNNGSEHCMNKQWMIVCARAPPQQLGSVKGALIYLQ